MGRYAVMVFDKFEMCYVNELVHDDKGQPFRTEEQAKEYALELLPAVPDFIELEIGIETLCYAWQPIGYFERDYASWAEPDSAYYVEMF